MGKGWKKSIKTANAQKKGAVFTKLTREIAVATKQGGADPAMNARLRMAIDAAKKQSCPNDTIDRAIKKGSGQLSDGAQIEEITYEGYASHGVGVLVECQTDNKHRTAPEIRNMFKVHGGHLGEIGSVSWMFEKVAYCEGTPSKSNIDPEEEAIEVGANEVEKTDDGYAFIGAASDLESIRHALTSRGWTLTAAEFSYKASNPANLNEEQKKEVHELLAELEDHDDTHRVHATLID